MLELRLFGTGQARYCGRPLASFPNRRPYVLLCYLLLNRHHLHRRERLAAVFWGEYPTPTSRKCLRNVLWRLRNALESVGAPADDYLLISDDSVSFSTTSRYWLDVAAFEATITRYQDIPGQELTPEQAAQLEEVVDLYDGDLLEGLYEDWCLNDRERMGLWYLNALSKLMVFHGTNGTYKRGLAYGERILAYDNTSDKIHRRMMWLYWLSGDRNAALAQYGCYKQILKEMGARPLEQITQLHQQMSQGRFMPAEWPIHLNAPLPIRIRSDESADLFSERVLRKLKQLQAIVEETSAELRHIERLISSGFLDST